MYVQSTWLKSWPVYIKAAEVKITFRIADFTDVKNREEELQLQSHLVGFKVLRPQVKIQKFAIKVVQIMCLAMHITNQKFSFDISSREFTQYLHGTWSLLNILMIFGIK